MLNQRAFEQRLMFGKSEVERRADEWRTLVHKSCQLVCELQAFNRARTAFLSEIKAAFGGFDWIIPCGKFPSNIVLGLGLRQQHGDAGSHEFVEACVRAGFVTRGEVDQWRNSKEMT